MRPGANENVRRRILRPSDKDLEMILNRLDELPPEREASRRQHKRFPFRIKSCALNIQQPGSSSMDSFIVHTRNLSARGMSFLHGGFVHIGSKCLVQLITTHGSWSDIKGVVMNCRYIEQGVHEVCMMFDSEIEPADFCTAAVTYRILLAEDDEAVARLSTHHLGMLNAEVDRAKDGEEAVNMATNAAYDGILMDLDMPVKDGLTAVRELREKGYTGRIVAVTAKSDPEIHETCIRAGCNQFVAKPIDANTFSKVLKGLAMEPLVSTYQDDPGMHELIRSFVETIPSQLRSLEEAMLASTMTDIEANARKMKDAAGGYGFETIAAAAVKLENSVQSGSPVSVLKAQFDELTKLCLLARGPAASP